MGTGSGRRGFRLRGGYPEPPYPEVPLQPNCGCTMKCYSFDHIPPFYTDDPAEPFGINLIVETPRGSRNKYAYKDKYGVLELRRILRGGMVWPCDFGFVPGTLAEDGDAVDVALLIDEPCVP